MIVFYTASYHGKDHYQKWYDLVLDTLKHQPISLISPELGNYQNVLTKSARLKAGSANQIHYAAIKKGIEKSDAVVIEMSHQDFQLGWEASLAVQAKKPVLCLSIHEDFTAKISHPYFHAAKYSEVTIDDLIEGFIRKSAKHQLRERFNFFLSPSQLEYLKKYGQKTHQKPSALLRSLIDEKRF